MEKFYKPTLIYLKDEAPKLKSFKRLFLISLLIVILATTAFPLTRSSKKTHPLTIGVLGKSKDVQALAEYVKSQYSVIRLQNVDYDNASIAKVLLIGDDTHIGKTEILGLTSKGIIGFCVLGAKSLIPTRYAFKTTLISYAYDIKNRKLALSNITEEEMRVFESEYQVLSACLTRDGVEKIYAGCAVNHEGFMRLARKAIDNLIEGLTSSQSSDIIVYADGSEWIKKWEDVNEWDLGYATQYTRFTVYRLVHPDDDGYEFWRVDPYIQQHITSYTWSSSLVGYWVNSREVYVDVAHGSQDLYRYGPTGTQTGATTSYGISFTVTTSGVGYTISYGTSWASTDVTTIDECDQVNDYAKWREEFLGPDYSWWPIMDWCRQPALVARTSYYSEPSLVVKTVKGDSFVINQMEVTREYYLDYGFYIGLDLLLHWTRQITTTWVTWPQMSWFPYRLSIYVYDNSNGWPLENMRVQCYGSDGSTLIDTKYTDWAGFTYFDLNLGSYKIVVSDPNNAYHSETRWVFMDKDKTESFYLELNNAPNTPSTPSGTTYGYTGTSYTYSTSTTDPDGDDVYYVFNWGDGSTTTIGPYASGVSVSASHTWGSSGTYDVKVKAKDVYGAWSGWSSSLTVSISSGGGGGGGCPTLFAWNGTSFAEEALLDIHASQDVTVDYRLKYLKPAGRLCMLSLRELENNTSHIDQVKLYAVDSEGNWHECHLVLAIHSELGLVTTQLSLDDDVRIDLAPSQRTELLFKLPKGISIQYFIFELNGYNMKLLR